MRNTLQDSCIKECIPISVFIYNHYYYRCDGEYMLHMESEHTIPPWQKSGPYHSRLGYIAGLNGDQISYATQSSRKVTIMFKNGHDAEYPADILPKNYHHTEERLYLGFNQSQFKAMSNHIASPQGVPVVVRFELKYQYFDRLRDSVKRLPKDVIPRIVLDGTNPLINKSMPIDLDLYNKELHLNLCSNDQLEALKATTSCTAGEPPLIITGPFGSGKTRVLALAAHVSFKSTQKPVRLLVCTQQHVSADAFLTCFNDFTSERLDDVNIVRVAKTVGELEQMSKARLFDQKRKVMVVTTCTTANTLLYKQVFPPGYFTHIYIDEGAQVREPEAVAPLGFANRESIIVIAGDQHQVCLVSACLLVIITII